MCLCVYSLYVCLYAVLGSLSSAQHQSLAKRTRSSRNVSVNEQFIPNLNSALIRTVCRSTPAYIIMHDLLA